MSPLRLRSSHPFLSAGSGPEDDRDVLLFIPHAGAAGESYMPFFRLFPSSLDCRFLKLPGRGQRMEDPMPDSLEDLAESILPELEDLGTRRISMFGHSMGALIAYELARRMRNVDDMALRVLFLSGCRPPEQPLHRSLGTLSDEALLEHVARSGGCGGSGTIDPVWLTPFLQTLRRDIHLCETYPYRLWGPLDYPIAVFWGTEDPLLDQTAQRRWPEMSQTAVSLHPFPGDHFYLQSQRAEIARIILARLDAN